jgi:hypothetical protein
MTWPPGGRWCRLGPLAFRERTRLPVAAGETDLEMVLRHVAQGERHVAGQRKLLAHLREIGGDTNMAERLLDLFVITLGEHCAHRDRLEMGPRPA